MKVIVIGGHFSPALGVIKAFPKDMEVVYVGRKYAMEGDKAISLEYTTVTSMGIPYEVIVTGRLQRKFTKYTLSSLLKLPRGFWEAFHILRKQKPDAVIGFGGYVSVPIGIAAFFLKIPLVLHEQTMGAGLANRMLSCFSAYVCISWESSKKFFPDAKLVLTGNPLMRLEQSGDVRDYTRVSRNLPLVVIVGGSQGSHAINAAVEEVLPQLLTKYQVIHQTGDAKVFKDFERLEGLKHSLKDGLGKRYVLKKFIHPSDMEFVVKEADIVVTRGGVNTITLLLELAKPSIVIPLPVSQHDEQLQNALFLKDAGIGEVLIQKDLTGNILEKMLLNMFERLSKYTLSNSELVALHKGAAGRVVKIVEKAGL